MDIRSKELSSPAMASCEPCSTVPATTASWLAGRQAICVIDFAGLSLQSSAFSAVYFWGSLRFDKLATAFDSPIWRL